MLSSNLQSRKSSLAFLASLTLIGIYALWQYFLTTWTARPALSPIPSKPANVAAIVEDRPLTNLVPLLLHFSSVLGPNWPILLFTSKENHPRSTPFLRAVKEGRISVRNLPNGVQFANHQAVSEFLTEPWFWEQLAPAGHVLLFQADSIICANADSRVEDFLQYDFVGAPISVQIDNKNGHGEGYNGGLSLRNRSMILDIIHRSSWKAEMEEGKIPLVPCVTQEPCLKFEDQWFYHKMKDVPPHPHGLPVARLPTVEEASKFAVETVWFDSPLGFHQVERWQPDNMEKVARWCPEYKLATADLIVNHGHP